ncbi:hypothetical protein CCACVL1_20571, partial [Corchorus capsularis]
LHRLWNPRGPSWINFRFQTLVHLTALSPQLFPSFLLVVPRGCENSHFVLPNSIPSNTWKPQGV